MSPIDRINDMLRLANSKSRLFPATMYYNEGWLLRLIVDWFSRSACTDHPLNFHQDARWFSEALLPSQFFALQRGDNLAEGWTHADGVIGHVLIGDASLADTKLADDAKQFIVTEAKMFSPLSPGVTRASYFDQAARNVACIAEILFRAKREPAQMSSLGFFVLAPDEQISRGIFARETAKVSIREKVLRRVSAYSTSDRDAKERWHQDWFLPTLEHIRLDVIGWEQVIATVSAKDAAFGSDLAEFYKDCLRFNRVQERETEIR
jgi:hypothetical protein